MPSANTFIIHQSVGCVGARDMASYRKRGILVGACEYDPEDGNYDIKPDTNIHGEKMSSIWVNISVKRHILNTFFFLIKIQR